ncbi:MAG: HmuY family protein [Deltaproteobacteria bacterium]|nr:HmuY family protein [Deltaproteobacteria bacterium]
MNTSLRAAGASLPLLALLWGCAADIAPEDTGETPEQTVDETGTTALEDGSFLTVVDAQDSLDWVYYAFTAADEVSPAQPADSTEWDLAVRRYEIALNGGVSGTGGVEVATLAGQDFDALTAAPAEGYVTDLPDADEDGDPEYALGDWFDYDSGTHVLTPKDQVYAVHGVGGAAYKLQVVDYYSSAGTSGYPKLHWAPLDLPQ